MGAVWIETFYQETDAPKRLELLKQNTENELTQADVFRKKLWVARYGKRKPTKDAFVGSLMELKCLAEGTSLDFGGQRRKQAAKIISTLCLADADSLDEELRENLLLELKNVFLKFMEVSRDGRGFTSLVFGMGQLSDEGVVNLIKDNEPISEWNIKNIHQLILKDIDNENAGRYRKENVTIKGATHIPPDYLKVPELMEKLILTYNTWSEYHPIIQAALLHGELVKIHPFVDGNGRTSRLLMNLVLMNNGYNPVIIKKESRLKYYEALDKAHITGNYTDFVKLVTKLEIEMLKKYLELL